MRECVRNLTNLAHEIKDLSTSKARAVCVLRANCRWVVTGTPIQNRLSELFSLFHFLRLHPYCEKENFDKAITDPWLNGDERGCQKLVKLLGYVMLRRPKTTISLPKRQDHQRFLDLSPQEHHEYDIAKQKAIECLEDAIVSGKSQEGYRNALQKINALRVICELGCSSKPGLHTSASNFLTPSSILPPRRTPDGSSTPSTTMEDLDGDDYQLEMDKSPLDPRPSNFEECFPSCTPLDSLDLGSTHAPINSPIPSGQWPTKIQALLQDLQSCPIGAKRYAYARNGSLFH